MKHWRYIREGLADYLNKTEDNPSVVIGYDSRIKSDVFAKVAADVFAANGIHVYLWLGKPMVERPKALGDIRG